MFAIDLKITDLNIKERNIFKVFFSMNVHQVATPEMMLEDAKSYVLFFKERKGNFSAYIALHLLTTNRRMFYAHSSNPFPEEQMNDVEEEAFAFAEGLGAMLDEVAFLKLSASEQDHWIDEQDIFANTMPSETPPLSQPAVSVRSSSSTAVPQTIEILPTPPLQQTPQPATQPQTLPMSQQEESVQPSDMLLPQTPEPLPASPEQQIQQIIHPQVIYMPQSVAPVQPQSSAAQETFQPLQSPSVQKVPPLQKDKIATPDPATQQQVSRSQITEEPNVRLQRRSDSRPHQNEASKPQRQAKISARQQQEIMQHAIRSGIAKPPVQDLSAEIKTGAGLVSRDREALARLLASF